MNFDGFYPPLTDAALSGGKFKNRGNKGVSQGITDDVMAIALFNGKIEVNQTKEALEKVTLASIEQWTEKI